MASNINPYNIDGTFPVAGQDNSSQGFRDNFTNTKNNFLFAQNEINDLQAKVLVTSALTGQAINNDMAGTQITRPQLAAWTQTLYDNGPVNTSAVLDFNVANFQKITTAGSISIGFINWPASSGAGATGYGLMRVWINVQSAAHTVTLPASVTVAVGDIAGYNAATNTITFDAAGNYVFDFSSIDGGNSYLIFDVTRNRNSLRDPNIYFNPAVTTTPTLFVGYGQNNGGTTALNLAIAGDQGQNIVSSLGSYNSVSVGNLSLANVTLATLDTGKVAGYTITSARGNLAQASIIPVQSNDYLGYINAVAFTGNSGTSNTFQQMSSMVFYATGPNPTLGLGGNIALFTAVPNDGGSQNVQQALGIENDQSVKAFGNLTAMGRATIGGNTSINGNATINGFATIGGYATIGGTATIGGNTSINGGLTTNGGRVDQATYVYQLALTGASPIVANNAISTVIIDGATTGTITTATVLLPTTPADRQTIKIISVAPITTANIYASNGTGTVYPIKWAPAGSFASGNVSLALTYVASNTTWYRS